MTKVLKAARIWGCSSVGVKFENSRDRREEGKSFAGCEERQRLSRN